MPAVRDGLQLWGGAECTVNRTHEGYRDQLHRTGHHDRAEDFALLGELGISAYRLPVLWERVAPDGPESCDWTWSDARIDALTNLGIAPIVGLVHHGSGPEHTSLLDPAFASGLARYARQVAERYPGIRDWTPVNEPLTTARFSALYGHWYPHLRDEPQFWLALLNQIDGVRMAMAAIREVIPDARLIQTEDLGRTYATGRLADQAGFDNARRWMSLDLLAGRVLPGHALWDYLCGFGLGSQLEQLASDPCAPDIIGINHYLTSDRFLDHRTERYPGHLCGSNGRQDYADVCAIRVLSPAPSGLEGALREAWRRYGLPLAVTEVHNGCTRDEQLRWTLEAWSCARRLRQEGMDIRAVTAWALFGSRDWNQLLTADGNYEAGAFDTRGNTPRMTALGKLLARIDDGPAIHPAIQSDGWWRRDIRFHHPQVMRPAPLHRWLSGGNDLQAAGELLIVGATGTLGQALAAACRHRNLAHRLVGREVMDLNDAAMIGQALDRYRPCAVLNAAGWVRVDDAESEGPACHAANAEGAERLARLCAARGIPTVSFSSDLVFPNCEGQGWREGDQPAPLNTYGKSKHRMEQAIARLSGDHLVIRTAAFFSPFDPHNFAVHVVESLREATEVQAARDAVVSPTYVPDLCDAVLDLLIDGETGLWHLSNGEGISWFDFARRIARECGFDEAMVHAVTGEELGWKAPRPANCTLLSERGSPMPSLDSAIARFALHLV
ncbi:family 1 glycosylhydrolase [Novosphingobium sp. TH158]|uniref:family 1 glycosylhydrolase n=1 Tax=Novosphingobium sp. TH158 TaxID=2067455 RepID=UPI000C7C0899|nr:family 1 glycosylhydrolase [Novosphingobium sp. TH158]PLK25956.1 dTDP-4-dehydrorhamnose reductase [Novosphingobium sp. TH158]